MPSFWLASGDLQVVRSLIEGFESEDWINERWLLNPLSFDRLV